MGCGLKLMMGGIGVCGHPYNNLHNSPPKHFCPPLTPRPPESKFADASQNFNFFEIFQKTSQKTKKTKKNKKKTKKHSEKQKNKKKVALDSSLPRAGQAAVEGYFFFVFLFFAVFFCFFFVFFCFFCFLAGF